MIKHRDIIGNTTAVIASILCELELKNILEYLLEIVEECLQYEGRLDVCIPAKQHVDEVKCFLKNNYHAEPTEFGFTFESKSFSAWAARALFDSMTGKLYPYLSEKKDRNYRVTLDHAAEFFAHRESDKLKRRKVRKEKIEEYFCNAVTLFSENDHRFDFAIETVEDLAVFFDLTQENELNLVINGKLNLPRNYEVKADNNFDLAVKCFEKKWILDYIERLCTQKRNI